MESVKVLTALIEKEFKKEFGPKYVGTKTKRIIYQIAQKYAKLKYKEGFEEGEFKGFEDGMKAQKIIDEPTFKELKQK